MERKTNWIAIAVAVVAAIVIGVLWYGPVFGQTWMNANGFTMDEANHKVFKDGVEMPMTMTPMLFNIAVMIAFALLMSWLTARAGANTWAEGAKIGAVVGLFMALNIWVSLLFAARPSVLMSIDGIYPLIQLTLMGAITGGWRKK